MIVLSESAGIVAGKLIRYGRLYDQLHPTGTNVGGEDVARAPRTLIETTRIFAKSDFARDWFGDEFVDHYAATRDWEWRKWLDAVTDWERKRYLEII